SGEPPDLRAGRVLNRLFHTRLNGEFRDGLKMLEKEAGGAESTGLRAARSSSGRRAALDMPR
ncbi:MAG TPA: hypothetical protein PK849_13560, partial [Synergistales bacterium]|nr:hypothetical protein [Synergistales bacterium]